MKTSMPTSSQLSPLWFIVPLILAITGIAAIRYQSRLITPPPSPITSVNQNTKVVTEVTAFFYTQIFLDRNQTFVSVPFRFPAPTNTQPLWLILLQADNDIQLRLMHHPTLYTLNWPSVEKDGVRLYQRQKNYSSIDQFISQPPAKDSLLLDRSLKDQPWFDSLQGVILHPQSSEFDLDSFGYILSTYQKPRAENDWLYYETTLDASSAHVNIKDELVWEIYAPSASTANPYLLGTIHIDYRQ